MELILKYFPDISEQQLRQLSQLEQGLIEWNAKINVISRKEMDQIEERHILHSLAIAKFHAFSKGTRIIDIGTGGGFPGLPLAILFPECSFTLVDSIAKKIRVVDELVQLIGLTNVKTRNCRAESIRDKYDFVVSRAVTAFPIFYNWTKRLVSRRSSSTLQNGIIALKGGNLDEELSDFRNRVMTTPISQWYSDSFFETKSIVYLPITGSKK